MLLAMSTTIAAAPLVAELSSAKTVAATGGRIIGAAVACELDARRIMETSKAVYREIDERAVDKDDSAGARIAFALAFDSGGDEVSSGRTSCADVRDAFRSLEQELAAE
ncbi:MAG: hypothetical protein AB7S71_24630 [Dongiaceae bacterium]|jgi:hypothetical protein